MILYLILVFAKTTSSFYDDVANISSYTDIKLLLAIQILLPATDSKDFVDRPTNKPLEEVLADFRNIEKDLGVMDLVQEMINIYKYAKFSRVTDEWNKSAYIAKKKKSLNERRASKLEILNQFVERNYHPVGYDITEHTPDDYSDSPRFFNNLSNENLLNMSKALQATWKELSRVSVSLENGGSTTLLNLPRPFIIPGGRFREFYYWDTYWILEGLLVSDMHKSAENIVVNFIEIINTYGYIPNGTRKYYLFRSEPPFFTMMLLKLLDIEGGKYNDLVFGEGLDAAIKEYEFWQKYKKISVEDKDGNEHELNYYHVETNFPRPESFSEDVITNEKQNKRSDSMMYSAIKSGAESGWDFSSRWLKDSEDLETIRASDQIPVDLNAILYRNEIIIYTLLSRKGAKDKALEFLEKSKKREEAINKILWNPFEGCWMDYLYKEKKHVQERFYFSNVTPMIYGITPPHKTRTGYDILKKYAKEIFGYKGGIPVSGEGRFTAQQWDYPNAWAPHQHMMVEFLLTIKEEKMAFHVAKQFFNSVYKGFEMNKTFFEKYDCNKLGYTGGGGEYAPQTGFGWTNGTILSFILRFGDDLIKEYDHDAELAIILRSLEDKTRHPPVHHIPEDSKPLMTEIVIDLKE